MCITDQELSGEDKKEMGLRDPIKPLSEKLSELLQKPQDKPKNIIAEIDVMIKKIGKVSG